MVAAAIMLINNQGQNYDIADSDRGQFSESQTYQRETRLNKAKSFLLAAVKWNNARAMYELGKIHLDEGKSSEASKLFNSASRLGHLQALVLAGKLSQLKGDNEDAVSKWTVAARRGCGEGCNELGVANYEGSMTGFIQGSKKEALSCFKKAATTLPR